MQKKQGQGNRKKESTFPQKGKRVMVIGGGDTGNDCVGTAIQTWEPKVVAPVGNDAKSAGCNVPIPIRGRSGRRSARPIMDSRKPLQCSGMIPRVYQTTVKEFVKDKSGNVCKAVLVKLETEKG